MPMGEIPSSKIKKLMPCAACKLLRRRCTTNCIFLPYFPPSEPDKFAAVHRIFGASNACKMLQDIPCDFREDAVNSMVYEAKARLRDPVYGSVGLIASLQNQVSNLHTELNAAIAEASALRAQLSEALSIIVESCQSSANNASMGTQNSLYEQLGNQDDPLLCNWLG